MTNDPRNVLTAQGKKSAATLQRRRRALLENRIIQAETIKWPALVDSFKRELAEFNRLHPNEDV